MKKELNLQESLNRMKNIIGLPINEGDLYEDDLFEIDWEGDFSDVKKSCMPLPQLIEYLNDLIRNRDLSTKDRKKFPTSLPFIHAKTRLLGADSEYDDGTVKGNFETADVETFIKRMTEPPHNVINFSSKMLKTGGFNDFVYKTGLPAFRGLAYDIQNKKFVIINTCPGAGTCRQGCYALSGRFIQYPASYDSMTRRLNYLLNFPKEYEERLYTELKDKCIYHKALKGYKFRVMFRWNDSGDFFTEKYVKMAENVINRLKQEGYNIISAAHTKIASVAQDSELDSTSFSADANKRELSKINPENQKLSVRFPSSEFKDLDLDRIDDLEILKERVAEYYDIPNIDDILSYDDMMSTKDMGVKKYYVIITPNDGDDAVYRSDVKKIIHTEH
jgi:hypothetical protein